MKTLVNLSYYEGTLNWFKEGGLALEDFLKRHGIDGVELVLYGTEQALNPGLIMGWHLRYWPYWLDLWGGNKKGLVHNLLSEEAAVQIYGGLTRQCLVDWYKKEFELAKASGAQYMVLHICNVDLHEVYTGGYRYRDEDVIDATIELVNAVFTGDSQVKLLFENLWWPGLRFDRVDIIERLLKGIHYKNVGFMLDIAHLGIYSGAVFVPEDYLPVVRETLDRLGPYAQLIKGIHLSGTPIGNGFQVLQEANENPLDALDLDSRFSQVMKTISSLDSHKPLLHPVANEIIELVKPEYVVYELLPKSLDQWDGWLEAIGNIKKNG